jgi:hypothetical protein
VSAIRNVISDLIEKRLWPVGLALVLALVAVPVVLGGTSSSDPGEATAGLQGAPDGTGIASKAAVKLDDDPASSPHARRGRVRNPFTQPRVRQPAPRSLSAPSSPRESPPTNPTGGTTGAGNSPAPPTDQRPSTGGDAPRSTPASESGTDPLDTYQVTLRVGRSGHLKTIRNISRLSPLPSADDAFMVFTGVLKDGKTAVFLLSSDATATGDGHCKPSAKSCQTIEVEQGDTEFFDLIVDGRPVQYQLDVVRVVRKGAKSVAAAAAANERHSVAGAAMLRSAHVNGSSAFKDAADYRWLPDRGVLVRAPKRGAGRASANGGAAASSADAAASLPGQPVWHWKLGG